MMLRTMSPDDRDYIWRTVLARLLRPNRPYWPNWRNKWSIL